MKTGLKNVLLIGLGAITGSLVTYGVVSRKYSEEYQKELEAINAAIDKKVEELKMVNIVEKEKYDESKKELSEKEYGILLTEEKCDESKKELSEEEYGILLTEENAIPDDENSHIYQISPDEYAEKAGYDAKSLTYNVNSNEVIYDTTNEVMEFYDTHIGNKLDEWIGEYSDQVLYVRNDYEKCDYEIMFNYLD